MAREEREEVGRDYAETEAEANRLLAIYAKACRNAGRGGLVQKKRHGKGWLIIITEPKK